MTARRESLLMPACNALPYPPDVLESILDQTYTDFELVSVNDGTRYRASTYAQGLAVQSIGVITQANSGLAVCGGEYLSRLYADSSSLIDRIAEQVAFLYTQSDFCLRWGYLARFSCRDLQGLSRSELSPLADGSKAIECASVVIQ